MNVKGTTTPFLPSNKQNHGGTSTALSFTDVDSNTATGVSRSLRKLSPLSLSVLLQEKTSGDDVCKIFKSTFQVNSLYYPMETLRKRQRGRIVCWLRGCHWTVRIWSLVVGLRYESVTYEGTSFPLTLLVPCIIWFPKIGTASFSRNRCLR